MLLFPFTLKTYKLTYFHDFEIFYQVLVLSSNDILDFRHINSNKNIIWHKEVNKYILKNFSNTPQIFRYVYTDFATPNLIIKYIFLVKILALCKMLLYF